MMFTRDNFRQIETPDVILCKANGERIGTLKTTAPPVYDHKFQELDELTFTVNMKLDDAKNEYYELIEVMKYIELKDIGFFFISDVSVNNEGTDLESKEVTCKSYECLMDQKYVEEFSINMGNVESIDGVSFYNLSDKAHSLLHLCLEKCPDWTIGHVDDAVASKQRSFEVTREGVYSFLNGEVAEAFECFFIFDTIHRVINVYNTTNYGYDTNIFVSYDNLLKNTNISCSTDDIKTCLTITGDDDLTVRELNMGYDRIYNFDYYNSTDFFSKELYEDYNKWVQLRASYVDRYNALLAEYERLYIDINYNTTEKMPDDPESTDWSQYGLTPLKEQLAKYESKQSLMIKAGYGEPTREVVTTVDGKVVTKRVVVPEYESKYMPCYMTIQALNTQIGIVQALVDELKRQQDLIQEQMSEIISITSMKNNFTEDELKELSAFIREEELNSSNYVVTDTMTDEEKFEMLDDLLKFGEAELYKASTPQLSFSAEIVDLFEMPEFDVYSGEFEVGNYIWVELRDDYRVKAKLLSIHYEFENPGAFSVEFGNVVRTSKNTLTTIQDVLNKASSAATSVSFNSSYWNAAAKDTDNISQMLEDGLLSAGNYISNGDDSELMIDQRGLFVTTKDGEHADKDSIFIGGGRILFTDDAWKTVSEAIGRVDVKGESVFGVLAKAVVAGYIAGSTIEGNTFNNGNGTFAVDVDGNLTATSAKIKGEITATSGRIGADADGNGGFVIQANKIYNTKEVLSSNSAGVYIGTDGIALGQGNTFSVNKDGYLTAVSGNIGGAIVESNSIHSSNGQWYIYSNGNANFTNVYISGVRVGSTFGQMYLDGNGYSFYNSSSPNPFQGNCVTHIQNLSANYVYANYLEGMYGRIGTIESNYISAATVEANYATIGSLNALSATVNSIRANYISTNNLSAQIASLDRVYGVGFSAVASDGSHPTLLMSSSFRMNGVYIFRENGRITWSETYHTF